MHKHHDIDIIVNLLEWRLQLPDLERALEFLNENPRGTWLLPSRHHIRSAAQQRELANHADDRLLGVRDLVDRPRDIVLKRLLVTGIEKGNRNVLVKAVHRQTEIKLLGVPEHLPLDPVKGRRILRLRIRSRIIPLEDNLTLAGDQVFAEQVIHTLRIGLEADGHPVFLVGAVEAQGDRILDLRDNVLCTVGQAIEFVRCQIDPEVDLLHDEVHGNDDHQGRHDPRRGEHIFVGKILSHTFKLLLLR